MSPRLASRCAALRMISLQGSLQLQSRRAIHIKMADFVTSDKKGALTKQKFEIFIGDPHEAFIIFDTDIGFAMKSAISNQTGPHLSSDPEKVPLTFFHDTSHFGYGAIPYPRIVIEQSLPQQNETNTSPATLWLWGASHTITLNGTPDHHFTESSRESHERLKGVAELLRHR